MFRSFLIALMAALAFAATAEAHPRWGGWGHHGHGVFRPAYQARHWGGWGNRYWGGGWGYRNVGYWPRYAAYRPWGGWGWGGYRRAFYYNSWPAYASYYYPAYSYPVYSSFGIYPYSTGYYNDCYSPSYGYGGYTGGYTTVGYNPWFSDARPTATTLLAEASRREPLVGKILTIAQRLRNVEQPATLARLEGSRVAGARVETVGRVPSYDPYVVASPAVAEARATLASRDPAKLLSLGDDSFRAGRYREALSRYDDAAERAPKLAESYFRQGHALVALCRYDEAALAFRRGIDIGGDVTRPGFRLDALYGSKPDETAHVEALAAHVLNHKEDSSAYFLLGMTLRYSADVAKSDKFFRRAADLSSDPTYLAGFVPAAAPAPIPVERATPILPVSTVPDEI
jgi:tetratricopeptide (TPR) repeat protein